MTRTTRVLLALVACGGVVGGAAQREPITRIVTVDGLAIRVRTAGLDARQRGEAVVVFESGATAPLETWDPVLPAVARFAPVVAYDRAGTGESGWDELPPTPERVVARLSRLLAVLAVPPPYVLVGHSWGGALVRCFSGAHPEWTAGVVYVDPTDITLTPGEFVALFESIGARAEDVDAFYQIMDHSMSSAPAAMRAEAQMLTTLLRSDLSDRRIPALAPAPASMIVAGRVAAPPQKLVPFDSKAYAKALHESQVRKLRTWVVEPGTFQVVTTSGHMVHVDDPEVVIEAIRRLVKVSR